MDPLAHTFTGAALAASSLKKTTPLATAALLIGVNLPDIDLLVSYAGDYMTLAHRRGWTHGILAWLVLPCLLTAGLLAWDKWGRRRRLPDADAASAPRLLALSLLAVLTHPAMDWLNNYGIRLLMPFDGRWFYGDALFIIDPWVCLMAGGASFIAWSRTRSSLLAWCLLWLTASWFLLTSPLMPGPAKNFWLGGLLILVFARLVTPVSKTPRIAQLALITMVIYMATCAMASDRARRTILATMASPQLEINAVMVGPVPVNPFRGNVIVETDDYYLSGVWQWWPRPHFSLNGDRLDRNLTDERVIVASNHPYARRFLTWSRFPFASVEPYPGGYRVGFGDARYRGFNGGIRGPVIRLDSALQIIDGDEVR